MSIGRYAQPIRRAQYKPLSFQELAFAPIQLRQREDALMNQQDQILNELNNLEGYEGFSEETEARKQALRDKFETLTTKIQTEGANNMNLLNDFRNLRNEYNTNVSKSGLLGQSAAIKQGIDKQRDSYYKFALQSGQDPTDIEANFQKELSKYKEGLPSKLSNLEGGVPEFNPSLAPQHQDIIEHATRYGKLMGAHSDEFKGVKFRKVKDKYHNVIGVEGYNVATGKKSNSDNVQAMANLLKEDLLDPNSKIAKDLAYKGIDPKDYLSKVDEIARLATSTQTSEATTPMSGNTSGTTSRSGKTTTKEEEVEYGTGSFVGTGSHWSKVTDSESTGNLKNRYTEIQNDPNMDPNEKQKQLSGIRQSILLKEKIEAAPEFKKAIDNEILENDGINFLNQIQGLQISNFEDYNNFIKTNPWADVKMKDIKTHIPDAGTATNIIQSLSNSIIGLTGQQPTAEMTMGEYAKMHMDELYKKASKPLLIGSEELTLGIGGDNETIQKDLSQGLRERQLMALGSQGHIDILSNPDPSNIEYDDLKPNSDQYNNIISEISSGNAKFFFKSLNTGNAIEDPSAIYQVRVKNGEDESMYDISIDLTNNDFTKELLSENGALRKNMNAEGRVLIDAMRQNLDYEGLATNFTAERDIDSFNERYNENTTSNILNYANTESTNSAGVNIMEKPVGPEKIVWENSFIKNDNHNYSVTLNENQTYSLYKARKDDGTEYLGDNMETAYTIGDFINKNASRAYVKEIRSPFNKNGVYSEDNFYGEQGEQFKRQEINGVMSTLFMGVTDPNNIESQSPFFNSSALFKRKFAQYRSAYLNEQNPVRKEEIALQAYKDLGKFRLETKSKKLLL